MLPVAAYVSGHLLMTELELCDLEEVLASFAQRRAWCLRSICVEQPHTMPAAFQELVELVERGRISTVLIPSLHHLAAMGEPLRIKTYLEEFLGGRVVVTGYS